MNALLPALPGDTEPSRPPGPDVEPSLVQRMAAAVGAEEVDAVLFGLAAPERRLFVHVPGEGHLHLLLLPEVTS